MNSSPVTDPHFGTPLIQAGVPLEQANLALVLLHGRGSSPEDILGLAAELNCTRCACLAPQAAGSTWYPNSFLAPLDQNEPWLSSALDRVSAVLRQVEAGGIAPERTVLIGFSQGACLALEYAARNPRRYAGLVALSGGLIGPHGTPRDYPGSLEGTPAFLGCSDVDPHIPAGRVEESARILGRLGAKVTQRIYPDMGHTVNADEVQFIRRLLASLELEK